MSADYYVNVNGKKVLASSLSSNIQAKLSDLVSKDTELAELVKGRQQNGTGGIKDVKLNTIEGVDFDVPETAIKSSSERQKLIQDYLAKDGINNMHPQYASKFKELNDKIRGVVVAA